MLGFSLIPRIIELDAMSIFWGKLALLSLVSVPDSDFFVRQSHARPVYAIPDALPRC